MNRYKWYKIQTSYDFFELSKLMLERKFVNNSSQGFLLSKITKNDLVGKFIQKKTSILEFEDPFGNQSEVTTTKYITTHFKFFIAHSELFMEIKNQPRSLKPFINTLNELLNFDFTIKSISISPLLLMSDLEKTFGKLEVNKISIYKLNIENKATANMQVTSESDIRRILAGDFFKGKEYQVKSIKTKCLSQEFHNGKVELFSDSSLVLERVHELTFIGKFIDLILCKDID